MISSLSCFRKGVKGRLRQFRFSLFASGPQPAFPAFRAFPPKRGGRWFAPAAGAALLAIALACFSPSARADEAMSVTRDQIGIDKMDPSGKGDDLYMGTPPRNVNGTSQDQGYPAYPLISPEVQIYVPWNGPGWQPPGPGPRPPHPGPGPRPPYPGPGPRPPYPDPGPGPRPPRSDFGRPPYRGDQRVTPGQQASQWGQPPQGRPGRQWGPPQGQWGQRPSQWGQERRPSQWGQQGQWGPPPASGQRPPYGPPHWNPPPASGQRPPYAPPQGGQPPAGPPLWQGPGQWGQQPQYGRPAPQPGWQGPQSGQSPGQRPGGYHWSQPPALPGRP